MYLNEKNITGDLPQVKFIFLPSYTKTIMCFNSEPAKMHSKCSVMVIVQQNNFFGGEAGPQSESHCYETSQDNILSEFYLHFLKIHH